MVLNCLLWSSYGLFLSNMSIVVPNLFGFCCGCYYIWLCYDLTENKGLLIKQTSIILLIYFLSVGISFIGFEKENSILILGLICCTASVLLFGSPLIVIKKVIDEKNSESIPGPLCIMNTISSFTWL